VNIFIVVTDSCSVGFVLGTETVAADFAYVDWQLYIIILCCSVANNTCWQADGQGPCCGFCSVSRDLLMQVD